jgi:ATP-dependent DNA helicase RecG
MTPTILGLLSIGKKPQEYIFSWVQFIRFDGNSLASPVLSEEKIGGRLADQIEDVKRIFRANNKVGVNPSVTPNVYVYDYPPEAFYQIIYNAFMHRSYEAVNSPISIYWFDNRIEITSPGGPFGSLTADNFGQPGLRAYRNPDIADALKSLGIVNGFGVGIEIARSEINVNGNPPLEFKVSTFVTAIMRAKDKK